MKCNCASVDCDGCQPYTDEDWMLYLQTNLEFYGREMFATQQQVRQQQSEIVRLQQRLDDMGATLARLKKM